MEFFASHVRILPNHVFHPFSSFDRQYCTGTFLELATSRFFGTPLEGYHL